MKKAITVLLIALMALSAFVGCEEKPAEPPHTHTLEKTEAQASTCTVPGHSEYWTCSECGKIFSDEACTTQTTLDEVRLPLDGNNHPEGAIKHHAATPAASGVDATIEYWFCERCGKMWSDEARENEITSVFYHTPVKTPAQASTCTTQGNIEYWTCSGCGKIFSDEACTTETTLQDVKLDLDSANHEHITHYEATSGGSGVDATIEYWSCDGCGKMWSDEARENEITSAAIHTAVKTEATASTCTTQGNSAYWTCSGCGKIFSDEACTTETTLDAVKLALDPNNHAAATHTDAVAATEGADGNIEYWTCDGCGKTFSDAECTTSVSSIVAHLYSEEPASWYLVEGSQVYGRYCSNCDAVIPEEVKIGDRGPAGGFIFYINKNAESDGWTYLESAPALQAKALFGFYVVSGEDTAIGTSANIGTGKANTRAIMEVASNLMTTSKGTTVATTFAAKVCDDYTVTVGEEVFDDWFLPSSAEFKAYYTNITKAGIDTTIVPAATSTTVSYSTSTEKGGTVNSISAYAVKASDATASKTKDQKLSVLPIRSF